MTSLAIYHMQVLKKCDVKQALVQSTLPDNEIYVLKPPAGCPHSNLDQYWHFI
jgi:hypothetical protein